MSPVRAWVACVVVVRTFAAFVEPLELFDYVDFEEVVLYTVVACQG